MLGELAGLCWDVVLLSESWSALGTVRLDSGHLFVGNTPFAPAAGVGVLLQERHVTKLKLVKQISLRLMFADVVLSHGTIRFVAAYAPHGGYSRDGLNQFYKELHACLEDARGTRFQLVVRGDFNKQLDTGLRATLLQDAVETFGHSKVLAASEDDFITCTQEMCFISAHATCNLHVGSVLPLRKATETSTGSTSRAPDVPCNFAGRTCREKTYNTTWP